MEILKPLSGTCFAHPVVRPHCNYAVVISREREMEKPGQTITFPSRWTFARRTHGESIKELGNIAKTLAAGAEAMAGLYMRMTDLIRESHLSDADVRAALRGHFPDPRISEILKVARAPHSVYLKYTAGFFGFKAALKRCRLYTIAPSEELNRRKVRRAAERLVDLLKTETTLHVRDRTITVSQTPTTTREINGQ